MIQNQTRWWSTPGWVGWWDGFGGCEIQDGYSNENVERLAVLGDRVRAALDGLA